MRQSSFLRCAAAGLAVLLICALQISSQSLTSIQHAAQAPELSSILTDNTLLTIYGRAFNRAPMAIPCKPKDDCLLYIVYPFIRFREIKVFFPNQWEKHGHYDKAPMDMDQIFGLKPSQNGYKMKIKPDVLIIA